MRDKEQVYDQISPIMKNTAFTKYWTKKKRRGIGKCSKTLISKTK